MLNFFWNLFSNDLAIDLGTANTLVNVKGQGIIISLLLPLTIDFVYLIQNLMKDRCQNSKGFCLAIYPTPCYKTS